MALFIGNGQGKDAPKIEVCPLDLGGLMLLLTGEVDHVNFHIPAGTERTFLDAMIQVCAERLIDMAAVPDKLVADVVGKET